MDKPKAMMFEWAVLVIGVWVAVSPIFLGGAGTLVFYGNVVSGVVLSILALHGLTSNNKKI